MRVSKVRRADAHPRHSVPAWGRTTNTPWPGGVYYFVRQRGRVSPAFLVQVSFVPVDDVPLEPAGEQN
jgi:hypothetical protein